jgi:hypothetical protein
VRCVLAAFTAGFCVGIEHFCANRRGRGLHSICTEAAPGPGGKPPPTRRSPSHSSPIRETGTWLITTKKNKPCPCSLFARPKNGPAWADNSGHLLFAEVFQRGQVFNHDAGRLLRWHGKFSGSGLMVVWGYGKQFDCGFAAGVSTSPLQKKTEPTASTGQKKITRTRFFAPGHVVRGRNNRSGATRIAHLGGSGPLAFQEATTSLNTITGSPGTRRKPISLVTN